MENDKRGDLVLSQNTYAYIQDGTSGNVEVMNGPNKMSLSETDKTVIYDAQKGKFIQCERSEAIVSWVRATEGQYIELTNPEQDGNKHPDVKSKQAAAKLSIGKKINIPGPETFALYPGQLARVIDGHQLKSNEYLLVRVYNETEAKKNIASTVVVANPTETENEKKDTTKKLELFDPANLITGKIILVKGTDVSFFIPPTGMEVFPVSENRFVRNAVTLEMLEYCILLGENGKKRFVNGPDVVFPQPTETFIEKEGTKKFRATELNENMGLYIKVIADYKDGDKEIKAGEELFITGKETKIYYPRAEHSIVSYDGQDPIHYATIVPEGEARYVSNKKDGRIDLVEGPKMLLPDPRTEVIVKRILSQKSVSLLFPGNTEAADYNSQLEEITMESSPETLSRGFVDDVVYKQSMRTYAASSGFAAMAGPGGGPTQSKNVAFQDEVKRKSKYTKPRTITIDSKYDGAVRINVWPGYAVQVISTSGKRRVEVGPTIILLKYDEDLEVLELSTGKPKTDHTLFATKYLQVTNNIVSDIIEAETSDMVGLKIRLSYRVNFEGDNKKWFMVSNYVKLLTQNCRSILRNVIKKTTIEEFNKTGADIIRDTIIGKTQPTEAGKDAPKRVGRKFEENDMRIYDVEVLEINIGDPSIDALLKSVQKESIKNQLELIKIKQQEDLYIKQEEQKRNKAKADAETAEKLAVYALTKLDDEDKLRAKQDEIDKNEAITESEIASIQLKTKVNDYKTEETHLQALSDISILATEKKLAAITPDLTAALTTLASVSFTEIVAKNLKQSNDGLGAMLLGSGGSEAFFKSFAGTPLETIVKNIINKPELQDSQRRS